MEQKKKIFFILHSMGGGGAERVISNISNYLVKHGYDITFLLTHSNNCVYMLDPSIKFIVRENVQAKDGLNQIRFIRSWYKKEKDAVFVSFLRRQNLYALIAAIGLNVKLVFSERHNPDIKFSLTDKGALELEAIKLLSTTRCCKKAVFQSQSAAKCYPKKTQKKGIVIPNPLKDNLIPVYSGERKKNIVAVGRLVYQKDYKLLIDAFYEFSKKHGDYTLQIYGEGDLKDKLTKYIYALNLQDKAELCGFCKDVHERIADAGIYVMSSIAEGLSNALLEALALGLPVISTDHPPGSAKEYINSYENGILTPVGDIDAMTKAMCYMAENPDQARTMGEKASVIRDELNGETICKKWEETFDNLY